MKKFSELTDAEIAELCARGVLELYDVFGYWCKDGEVIYDANLKVISGEREPDDKREIYNPANNPAQAIELAQSCEWLTFEYVNGMWHGYEKRFVTLLLSRNNCFCRTTVEAILKLKQLCE